MYSGPEVWDAPANRSVRERTRLPESAIPRLRRRRDVAIGTFRGHCSRCPQSSTRFAGATAV